MFKSQVLSPWKSQEELLYGPSTTTSSLDSFVDEFLIGKGIMLNYDLEEMETKFTMSFDVPGVDKEDIELELVGKGLKITAQREKTTEQSIYNKKKVEERQFGSFSRVVYLPKNVDTENITADMKNGVLTVNVPKMKKKGDSSKKIPISSK